LDETAQAQPDAAALADAAHDWKSAYIHIPFCARRCPYCDFAIVEESASDVDHKRYVDAVVAEIGMEAGIGRLDAVNFGGGTPSRVEATLLDGILRRLEDLHGFADDVEISIEVNPEDWSDRYAAALIAAGFNRVSIGAQSMDDTILGVLGRLHRAGDVDSVVRSAREAGFRSVSVDLILGHPNESESSWDASVAAVLALPIDHVSTYSLTVEPGTEMAKLVRDGLPEPDDDMQAARYERFIAASLAAGFARYEVSNHARPGHVCSYNLSTWSHGEYVAFGMGAHDHRWGLRSRNHRRMDRYLEAVDVGIRPRLGSETLDLHAQERDRLMLGLRLAAGTPRTNTADRFAHSEAAQRLVAAGILSITENRLVVADPMLSDAVAREALSVSAFDC
jgi:oxygen-independent coproporphyrinogen-3 oxidase